MIARVACRVFAPFVLAAPVEAQWAVSAQPTVRIGNESSAEYQFNGIERVRRLSDGRIVVSSGPDIRFFDSSGKYLSKAGGRGRGPGEFLYVSDLLVMPGDSLMTMNVRTIVVLDPEGKFVRQFEPDYQPLSTGDWFTEGSVLLPNGNLLSPQMSREEGSARVLTLRRPKKRYSILDVRSGRVTVLHQGGGYAQQLVNGRPNVMPFTPYEQVAVGRDRVYVGDNDSTAIHAFDVAGRPLGTFTVADEPTPVTAAELETVRQRGLEWAARNGMSKQAYDLHWSEGPKPKRHPFWGMAVVDATGVLWVSGPLRAEDAPIAWTTYDRNGKRLASVTMPARFTPQEIGTDYILGVQRDEDGVETIAIHALRRR